MTWTPWNRHRAARDQMSLGLLLEALESRQLLSDVQTAGGTADASTTSQPAAAATDATTTAALAIEATAAISHAGILHTEADYQRMQAKVAAGEHPWIDSWNRLIANPHAQLSWNPAPVATLIRGSTSAGSENYSRAYHDAAAAYQTALRWKISGDARYADKAVQILSAWGTTLTSIQGDTNASLAAGLYGYQFAIAGEVMRDYAGWAPADFAQFQSMMRNTFLAGNNYFLNNHHGTTPTHYWANWDLCNLASKMAIGVLLDDVTTYNEAVEYFKSGIGTGNIHNGVFFVHPGKLGQWQESGRDQGHAALGVPLLATIAEIAWNQGDDLYSYNDNAILAATEYITRYNLGYDVPYVTYVNSDGLVQSSISSGGRGNLRPGAESIYNHYVNRMGIAAPYTAQYAALVRPDGGGGNYGPNSGGYDQLGFNTLTDTLDPIAAGAKPSGLTATVYGSNAVLSWWGSAYATSYNIKRATSANGPYTTIATGVTGDTTYTDYGVQAGATYYYVVSAVSPAGETANSDPAPSGGAIRNNRLLGTTIGSPGSWNNRGAGIQTVFDGTIRNHYDAANATGDWAGLDFGEGVTHVITQVRFAPRAGFAGRMVGGRFQGSNDPTFATGVVTLFTISSQPATGVMTTATINNTTPFRYVRYLGPTNGSCNVAEVEFYGYNAASAAPAAPTELTAASGTKGISLNWSAAASAAGYTVKRATTSNGPYTTIATGVTATSYLDTNVIDGSTYHYVVAATNAAGNSSDSSQARATVTPRPTLLNVRPTAIGQLQLTWAPSPGATGYAIKRATTTTGPYTVIANVTDTSFTDTGLSDWRPYYYVVSASDSNGGESRNSAEAWGVASVAKLTGTTIGTAGSWGNNPATTRAAAMDGNLSTFFDAPIGTGAWVGLELASPKVITNVRYAPRSGYEGRMLNGVFQGANTADFSDAVTLFTITTTPTGGSYTTQSVSDPSAYRYVRYLSPASGYCNVAEIEFYGYTATTTDTVAPTLTSAVSRKTHGSAGTFDLGLSLDAAAAPTVEPRRGGPDWLVLNFSEPIFAADDLLDASEFTLTNASFDSATLTGTTLTLRLTSVATRSRVTVNLTGLIDAAGNALAGTTALTMRSLYGDVNRSGSVTVADQQAVKNSLFQPLSPTNYLLEVNLSGTISVADQQVVKNQLFASVP